VTGSGTRLNHEGYCHKCCMYISCYRKLWSKLLNVNADII